MLTSVKVPIRLPRNRKKPSKKVPFRSTTLSIPSDWPQRPSIRNHFSPTWRLAHISHEIIFAVLIDCLTGRVTWKPSRKNFLQRMFPHLRKAPLLMPKKSSLTSRTSNLWVHKASSLVFPILKAAVIWQYTGESMNPDGMVALLNYRVSQPPSETVMRWHVSFAGGRRYSLVAHRLNPGLN